MEGDSEQDDGEFVNTDLKYYDIMDANDKLQTLTNRSKDLQAKQKEMYARIQQLQIMYPPIAKKNSDDNSEDSPESDSDISQLSGLSSARSNRSDAF